MARPATKPPVTAEALRQRRREIWQRDRSQSDPLRAAHPQAEQVKVDMTFDDESTQPPSSQIHLLHPPAKAFFRFPCPYAGCDGEYDLGPAINGALSSHRRETSGKLVCEGLRIRDRQPNQKCGLHLKYVVTAKYKRDGAE
jgi:hypothetical protein